MERVTIKTEDGIDLAGLLWDVGARTTTMLLHMMPATKESWSEVAQQLSERGSNVLAIDFRGHGESGGGDYRQFKPEQHNGYFKDVQAAAALIRTHFSEGQIMLVGASIGANLSLWYASERIDCPKVVALSAGLDYYGVRAIDYVQRLSPTQSILLVGSYNDGRGPIDDCGHMAEELYARATSQKEKIIYSTGGHGTNLFQTHSELSDRVVNFLIP